MKSLIKKIAAAITITAAFTGCKGNNTSPEGKVLNIACWNEEFKTRFTDHFVAKGLLPEDIKINWIKTPNENTVYQSKLDELLVQQMDLPNDERLDIFLVEADYALKYADTPYTLDVIRDIGLTEDDLKNQYPYTKEMMTDHDGRLKGVSWQACPGGFIYRRSIAKDVFGTDEPSEIQKNLKNWVLFDNSAGRCKEKGYYMLAGYDDAFRVFSDNAECPFVTDNKLTIPSTIKDWVSQTKIYTEKGYNHRAILFSDESARDAGQDGKVFGYFGPAWYIDYFLAPASLQFPKAERTAGNGSYGDWAFCAGPKPFNWGGTWICAAAGTDNKKLIREIMYTLTCKKDVMAAIAKEAGDFTNNAEAMKEVAESDYKNPFLGGQNHIKVFLENAKALTKKHACPYDQGLCEKLQESFSPFFAGDVTEDDAWNHFYEEVEEMYPNLECKSNR